MRLNDDAGGEADVLRRWLARRSANASADVRMRVPPDVRGVRAAEPIDDDPAAVDDVGGFFGSTLRPVPSPTARQRQQLSDATYAARSTSVGFAQPTGLRRLVTGLVLVMGATAVLVGIVAYQERTQPTVLAAACLAFLTLVLWGVRAATPPTSVVIEHGVLAVRRAGRVEKADLANARTPIAVVGKSSSRRWRVLVERSSEPLLVVDASMVDPEAFTEVLCQLHPQLWSEPGAVLESWRLR